MAECSRCKAETQLHLNGVPVCPDCDDAATHAPAMAFSALNSDSGRNLNIDRPGNGESAVSSVPPERP